MTASLGSLLNTGVNGLNRASSDLVNTASNIARVNIRTEPASPTAPVSQPQSATETRTGAQKSANPEQPLPTEIDLNEELIDLKREELLFKANAEVIATSDRAIGSLINTSA